MKMYAKLKQAADIPAGTELMIQTRQQVGELLKRRKIDELEIAFEDGRMISPQQRRKAYATLRDISEYTGYTLEAIKEIMKVEHMLQTGEKEMISLSDCSMTQAKEFINTLMEYALKEGVILTESGLSRTDDIDRYLIQCLKYRRCCICGRKADIHHVQAIGMGNDRMHYDDSENEVMALCRVHHTAYHTIGVERFTEMYKVYGIRRYRITMEEEAV